MPEKRAQPTSYITIKNQTNDYIDELLGLRINGARQLSERYVRLWQSIEQLVHAGGKRIRPYLLNLICEAYGGRPKSKTVLQAGGAIELLHLSLLIHDDIIDGDLMRHNAPNITGQYLAEYSKRTDREDALHHASSAALLAGDLLLIEAYAQINDLPDTKPTVQKQINAIFNEAIFTAASGELADIESNVLDIELDRLEIDRQKTASYSFAAPLLIGATLGGAPRKQLADLRKLANSLGIIYQLKDDLADDDLRPNTNKISVPEKINELITTSHAQIGVLAIPPNFKLALQNLLVN